MVGSSSTSRMRVGGPRSPLRLSPYRPDVGSSSLPAALASPLSGVRVTCLSAQSSGWRPLAAPRPSSASVCRRLRSNLCTRRWPVQGLPSGVLPKPFPRARKPRHHGADRDSEDARNFSIVPAKLGGEQVELCMMANNQTCSSPSSRRVCTQSSARTRQSCTRSVGLLPAAQQCRRVAPERRDTCLQAGQRAGHNRLSLRRTTRRRWSASAWYPRAAGQVFPTLQRTYIVTPSVPCVPLAFLSLKFPPTCG